MRQALAPVAALLVGVSLLLTGQGLQGTLLPVRAAMESFTTVSIGIMGAAYFLGFTVGCLRGGQLVQRVGHVRVFLAMASLASAAPLLHGMVLNPMIWGVLRALTGFCFAVLYLVIESWLNERADNDNRGTIFSTYVMITLTVLAAGQMMTLLYDPLGLELFIIASILVSLGAIPVALSTSPSPEQPQSSQVDVRKLFRLSPSGATGCLVTGLTNGAFFSMAAIFAAGISGDATLAAWFMTSAVVGGAVAQWPLGYLSDRLGRRRVILLAGAIGTAAALLLVSFAAQLSFVSVNVLAAAWGAVAFPLYSISVAHANDYTEPQDYVMVSGGLLLMYGIGAVLGPFLASLLMTRIGVPGLFAFTAVAHIALCFYLALRMLRRKAPDENTIDFVEALASAHTASQVYEEERQQDLLDEQDAEQSTGQENQHAANL